MPSDLIATVSGSICSLDVAELERDAARGEIDVAHLTHEAEVLVVDGDADLFALLRGRLCLRHLLRPLLRRRG